MVKLEFMECKSCSKKLGTPTLCDGCLHNRKVIMRLNSIVESWKSKAKVVQPEDDQYKIGKDIALLEQRVKALESAIKRFNDALERCPRLVGKIQPRKRCQEK